MRKLSCTPLRCCFTALALVVSVSAALGFVASAQESKKVPAYYGPQPATENIDLTMYSRIRTEGFEHGKVMDFAAALADGIGPRLTGSPNLAKANAWTRDTMTKIGLENAHLEDWGDFGMGWYQINTWRGWFRRTRNHFGWKQRRGRPQPRVR